MSGPIVRKYGFPNFDQIFGKRELEHGVDEDEKSKSESEAAAKKSEESKAGTEKPSKK